MFSVCLYSSNRYAGTVCSARTQSSRAGRQRRHNDVCVKYAQKCENIFRKREFYLINKNKVERNHFVGRSGVSVVHELIANGKYSRLNYLRLAHTADTFEMGTNNKSFLPGKARRVESVLTDSSKSQNNAVQKSILLLLHLLPRHFHIRKRTTHTM